MAATNINDDIFLDINYYLLAEIVFNILMEYDEDKGLYSKRKEIKNGNITIIPFNYDKRYEFLKKIVDDIIKTYDLINNKSNQEKIKYINDLINENKKDNFLKLFNGKQFNYP